MSLRRWAARAGFAGAAGSVLASGVVRGLHVLSLRVETAAVVVVVALSDAVLSSVTFAALTAVSGGLFVAKLVGERARASTPATGDRVVAVVPAHREAAALDRSVRSLVAARYDDLAVRIVVEPDDDATRRRADRLAAAHGAVEVLVNGRPGTKAGAVNHAVEAAQAGVVGVFDADEVVHPNFVGHAVALLDDGADVVQGRTVPEPTGVVEELAYCESVVLSYAGRRLLYRLTGFRAASSRAVVMDRAAFERAGGYDPAMLTEDFDFAYRCYRERLAVRETLRYPSRIEAAHGLRDWWGQRKRWMAGYAQVLRRLVADADPTDYRSLVGVAVCASTIAGSGLTLSLLSKFAVLLLVGAEAWFLPPVGAVLAVALAVRVHDARSIGIDRPRATMLATPFLLPLYGLVTIRAVAEYLLSWDGEWYAVEREGDATG